MPQSLPQEVPRRYRLPVSDKRRYPHHGQEAVGTAYMDKPRYFTFMVVLDKKNWAKEDGVLIHWDDLGPQSENPLWQRTGETLTGRLPGMGMVAASLAGLI
ncbi:hypothetical protein N7G274_000569 [Stereocaulon virgatum]|uniref:Uncharacterized protein n=1 Tax=Stereocaulon virgatum TaxID=373712 RepID=A0ABR4ASI4_9LECA